VLNDDNVFNEIPEDRYPFNPTANGHEWKKWEGDTSAEAIGEMNVFDHGQGLAAINLGEHAITDEDGNGIPFKCRDPGQIFQQSSRYSLHSEHRVQS